MLPAYDDLVVWAIASREDPAVVAAWAAYHDVGLPVLLDLDGSVDAAYPMPFAFPTGAYPREWLIGRDGTIVYVANRYEPEALAEAIDRASE